MWVRCGERVSPLGEGPGEGAVPPPAPFPEFFFIFELKKTTFGVFWVLFFAVEWKLVRSLSGMH